MDGAPKPVQFGEKSYDKKRRQMAEFLGLDFLFARKEFCQSIQTDSTGRKVLVNSDKFGELLAVKPVPEHLAEKPWFKRRMRYPREYLGITKIDERVSKLSELLHIVTRAGIPSRHVLRSLNRLSIVWWKTRYKDMRKHANAIILEIMKLTGLSRSPGGGPKGPLPISPRVFSGVKIHNNGISAPLWSRVRQ